MRQDAGARAPGVPKDIVSEHGAKAFGARRIRALGVGMMAGVAVALAVGGCGAAPDRCAESAPCPRGTACDPSGSCAALVLRPGERSAQLVRLAPADWAVTRADIPERAVGATDVLELGG